MSIDVSPSSGGGSGSGTSSLSHRSPASGRTPELKPPLDQAEPTGACTRLTPVDERELVQPALQRLAVAVEDIARPVPLRSSIEAETPARHQVLLLTTPSYSFQDRGVGEPGLEGFSRGDLFLDGRQPRMVTSLNPRDGGSDLPSRICRATMIRFTAR